MADSSNLPGASTSGPKKYIRMSWPLIFAYALPIVLIAANFRDRAYEDKSVDFQVALRMSSFFFIFLIPFVTKEGWRAYTRLSIDNMFYALLLYYMATAFFVSPLPFFSAFNAFSMLTLYHYTKYLVNVHGVDDTAKVVMAIGIIICFASLVVYVVNPEFAKMRAWNGVEHGAINRLRGITGTANAIGALSAITIAVAVMFWKTFTSNAEKWFGIAAITLSLICLIMSNSRTSMGGMLFVLYFYFMVIRGGYFGFITSLVVGALLFLAFSFFSDAIFTSLSRSGSAEEITSGTGRTEIWAVAWEYFTLQPFFGYGFFSSRLILPIDPRLFSAAAHAHNALLEVLFSGGIFAFVMYVIALVYPMAKVAKTKRYECLSLYIYFLLNGITEALPFSGIGLTTFVLFFTMHAINEPAGLVRRSHQRRLDRPFARRALAQRAAT